jgi:hypothetical protein
MDCLSECYFDMGHSLVRHRRVFHLLLSPGKKSAEIQDDQQKKKGVVEFREQICGK